MGWGLYLQRQKIDIHINTGWWVGTYNNNVTKWTMNHTDFDKQIIYCGVLKTETLDWERTG